MCGALIGAVIAIGIGLGRSSDQGDREPSYDAARRAVLDFVKRFGSTSCSELTGLDLTTPEGRHAWADRGFQEKCSEFVEWAVGHVYDLGP